jgi:hypothetical protein
MILLFNVFQSYIHIMKSRTTALPDVLKVGVGKEMNRFLVGIYLVMLIVIPWLGWVAFGPGTAGDTKINGNSIFVFWIMRFVFLAGWITCLIGFKRSLYFLRDLPLLYTLDKIGITDRNGTTTL